MVATNAAMDIEDEGPTSDKATTFEPIHLEDSIVQIMDRRRPIKGQALVNVVVRTTRD